MQVPNENASSNTYLESNLTNSGNGNLFGLTKYKTGDSQSNIFGLTVWNSIQSELISCATIKSDPKLETNK